MDYLLLEHRSLAQTLLDGIRGTLRKKETQLEDGDGEGKIHVGGGSQTRDEKVRVWSTAYIRLVLIPTPVGVGDKYMRTVYYKALRKQSRYSIETNTSRHNYKRCGSYNTYRPPQLGWVSETLSLFH